MFWEKDLNHLFVVKSCWNGKESRKIAEIHLWIEEKSGQLLIDSQQRTGFFWTFFEIGLDAWECFGNSTFNKVSIVKVYSFESEWLIP